MTEKNCVLAFAYEAFNGYNPGSFICVNFQKVLKECQQPYSKNKEINKIT